MSGRDALVAVARWFASTELLLRLRWEMSVRVRTLAASLSVRQRATLARLRGARNVRVNLGSGPNPAPGWLNVDAGSARADLVQDLGRPLDLPDACAEIVFSEHVLEHLDFPDQARTFLREAFRILEPGGTVRLVVPDAEKALRAYAAGDRETLRQLAPTEASAIEAVNRLFRERGFHRFAWDFDLLRRELEGAGFVEVHRSSFRGSSVARANIDFDEPERIVQSLYVEARKP